MCALLEDTNVCCICGKAVHRRSGGVPAYYCAACFEVHKDAIIAAAAWVKYLMNLEKQRRKRLRPAHVGVGDNLDGPIAAGIDSIANLPGR